MFVYDKMLIKITEDLNLRPLVEGDYETALKWYENKNILWYSENRQEAYKMDDIKRMYAYLSNKGEVYVIEYKGIMIGDVTLSEDCMPIVIMPDYQGLGLGKLIINSLIKRARNLGWASIKLSGIYLYNDKSQSLFKSCGFVESHRDDKKIYMTLELR
ncbi:GNAT family N-acetyltransferase [Acidaminobacter sp. JC074]|uniref:GNAT family N-acetyltransferase n=1 Tax=Acidaminobacter sp. JC074 TaxID=2530199 RepID=UPI001F0F03EC|nr:GNAT family N-acetyltransferase [Acidaminobacter sp. JC074]MCH4887979.1 GNAT family N-acetyltransferase [Acidaminobacter sp. JC074]